MNKIGILYICTGRYAVFWKRFYETSTKRLFKDAQKYYYVWTDNRNILLSSDKYKDVTFIYQACEEWPFPTLKRYEYFLKKEDELKKMDYLVFFNSNLVIKKNIYQKDILPDLNEELFVTLHPGFYCGYPGEFTYDNNPKSHAYLRKNEGKYYFAGGLNGGKAFAYIKLMHDLSNLINIDLKMGIVALWHDESYLNKYINDLDDLKYRIISPAYLYPEGWKMPFEKKIIVLDKNKIGGHSYLRKQLRKQIEKL